MRTIKIGISTCPNDTFAFHALLRGIVQVPGLQWEFSLLDIEQLNQAVLAKSLHVAKSSFHLAMLVENEYRILSSGAALGFGVGPLLLAARPGERPVPWRREDRLTLCPGEWTTAALLFEMFYPQSTAVEHVVFSEIMPRLIHRAADFGVCIHEGRFTWQEQELSLVEDLGTRWETETGKPLPLGGILASRQLPADLSREIELAIAQSIRWAQQHPDQALETMREYAQEFNDEVLMKHVELYVNEWTLDLGTVGWGALDEFRRRYHDLRARRDQVLSAKLAPGS